MSQLVQIEKRASEPAREPAIGAMTRRNLVGHLTNIGAGALAAAMGCSAVMEMLSQTPATASG